MYLLCGKGYFSSQLGGFGLLSVVPVGEHSSVKYISGNHLPYKEGTWLAYPLPVSSNHKTY